MFKINNIPLLDNKSIDTFNNRKYQLDQYPVAIGIPRVSEGINLTNIQNIHIATPSRHFNISETEQAIARGIRFSSHKDLLKNSDNPINIKIYKYINIPVNSRNLEPNYDLSINYDQYLRAEIKDYNIKQIDRLLKESAVDCQLNYNRNMTGNIDFSRDCEYNKCEYKCEGISNLNPELNFLTYNLYYADKKEIAKKIKKLFQISFIYTYSQIKNEFKKYRDFVVLSTLSDIINNREIIYNKWGI